MPGFLDRVRREIDRSVVQVGAKSKQLVETTQLHSQIRLLRTRREEGLRELGQVAYEMLRNGPFDLTRVEPYISTLKQLDSRIVELEEQIRKAQANADAAIRATRPAAFAYCQACGTSLRETSKFCPNCGVDVTATVARAAAQGVPTPTACPSCGSEVGTDSRFCPMCGHVLPSKPEN